VTKTITIGMRGDTNDEITGLNVGDKVVVALAGARSSSLTSRTGAAGLGGFGGALGGGAVRIGGGG
jgi:hypothetical protein